MTLAKEGIDAVLAEAGLAANDVAYIATTSEGETVTFATGHFDSMTTHARSGVFLAPEARAAAQQAQPGSGAPAPPVPFPYQLPNSARPGRLVTTVKVSAKFLVLIPKAVRESPVASRGRRPKPCRLPTPDTQASLTA
jgi:hypothetical protein